MQKTYLTLLYLLLAFISILVVLTRGRNSLVKRKLLLGLMVLSLTAPAATLISCKSGSVSDSEKTKKLKSEGWIDDNTFRITASGPPRKTVSNPVALKASARESAILMAQKMIIEKFRGARIQSCSGMADFELTGVAFVREFNEIIKNGKIIVIKWDDDSNCEILYEVKALGLKKRVNDAYNQ